MKSAKDDQLSSVKNKKVVEEGINKKKIYPIYKESNHILKKEINATIFRELSKKEENGLL